MEPEIITQPDNEQIMKDGLWREDSVDKSYIFLINKIWLPRWWCSNVPKRKRHSESVVVL